MVEKSQQDCIQIDTQQPCVDSESEISSLLAQFKHLGFWKDDTEEACPQFQELAREIISKMGEPSIYSPLNEHDRFVIKVLDLQNDLDLIHQDPKQFINQIKIYQMSFRKFNITSVTFFDILHMKNAKLEQLQLNLGQNFNEEETKELQDDTDNPYEETRTVMIGMQEVEYKVDTCNKKGLGAIYHLLPQEIKVFLLNMLPLSSLFRVVCTSKDYNELFNNKKLLKNTMKQHCMRIWPQERFLSSKAYLTPFKNWRHMLATRPFLRFDGLYICKMKYYKSGLSDCSAYAPIHEVIMYKYLKLNRDGTAMTLYTVHSPKKIFERIKNYFLSKQDEVIQIQVEQEKNHKFSSETVQLLTGQYYVANDWLVLKQFINNTEFRYDFQLTRNSANLEKKQVCNYLDLQWQGFKDLEENDKIQPTSFTQAQAMDVASEKAYINMKIKSIIKPTKFIFYQDHQLKA